MEQKDIVDMAIALVIFLVISIVFIILMFAIIRLFSGLFFAGNGDMYGGPAITATGLILAAALITLGGTLFKK